MDPKFAENIFQPLHVKDDPEPQPVPLHAYFADEMAPASRQRADRHRSIAVDRCRFGPDGSHSYVALSCPHGEARDEQGPVQPRGWTVQG